MRASILQATPLVLMLTLAACRAAPQGAAIPAVIDHPTAASRADLELAVSQALGNGPVRLASDALTRSASLIVGRAQAHDARGLPLNGRELAPPQHFQLLLRGSQCELLHLETGKSTVLAHASCRPTPDDARN
ncbi:MAG TPA: hypothetical protein VGN43_03785 [Steroidobacteraceae bacterium]|jgi:hypothetical protein|nr:hypothetical protein [Steroidobacteraceae bacterium]